MRPFQSLLLCLSLFGLVACEEVLLRDSASDDPRGNFESLHQTVQDKYSFFELKQIDWDSVKQHYAPQIHEDMAEQELFDVLDSMLYDLRDGHVNMVSPFDLARNWEWYLNAPVNFNYDMVERNYLGSGHKRAGGLQYTVIGEVGYVYYPSFSSSLSIAGLRAMMDDFKDTKGLIVDIRNNGGGSLSNAYLLASYLISDQREVLRTFDKTGPGPGDFGNAKSLSLAPANVAYTKPICLLTNRMCYSAANTFAAILSNYDHVQIFGDQTGGGGGLPIDFELPNGWYYRFSGTTTLLPNGYNIELGVPVDFALTNDPAINASVEDEILEAALDFLN